MRINSLHLKGFKRFSNSRIFEMNAKFVSNAVIIAASNASGKALDNDSLIRIPNGWKRMGDIKVGDIVISKDGTPTKVLGVFPQGRQQIYRVTFWDYREIKCTSDHLWSVYKYLDPEPKVLNTLSIYKAMQTGEIFTIDTIQPDEENKDVYKEVMNKLSTQDYFTYTTDNYEKGLKLRNQIWSIGGICRFNYTEYPTKIATLYYNIPSEYITFKNRIMKITPTDEYKECTCIYVDHPSHLYVTENYIVTHNTSLLRELSPLPSKSDNYNKGGYKELNLTHNNDEYILSATYDRNVNYSFIKNGVELNLNGLFNNQKELVEKHLGFTDTIEKLVYNKFAICRSTVQERKDLFTKINSMNLELVDTIYKLAKKATASKKNQLSLMYNQKTTLESKLIPSETLAQYKQTKAKLEDISTTLDKNIYALNIHINKLKESYQELIEYSKNKLNNNQPIIHLEKLNEKLRSIRNNLYKYSNIDRNNFVIDKQTCKEVIEDTTTQKKTLEETIANLSKEINEYDQHINNAKDKPKNNLENEIKLIKKEMKKYDKLPKIGIPKEYLHIYIDMMDNIKECVFTFRDINCKMIDPIELNEKIKEQETLHTTMMSIGNKLSTIENSKKDYEKELMDIKLSSGIPDDCKFSNCKLRENVKLRIDDLTNKIKVLTKSEEDSRKELDEITKKYNSLTKYLAPFVNNNLIHKFNYLEDKLNNTYFSNLGYTKDKLLEALNTQPVYIFNECNEYIENSKNLYEYNLLVEKCKNLETELNALMKSADVSISFIEEKRKEKNNELNKHMDQLKLLDNELNRLGIIYKKYIEYTELIETMSNLRNYFNKGLDAIELNRALNYFDKVIFILNKLKVAVNEKLVNINNIVKEQDSYRDKLYNDNSKVITNLEQDKLEYGLIEKALSPTTGFAHRYMIKYLNGLIKNANTFLSQIWKFRLELQPLSFDDELNYKFKILIGDTLANDITKMSDGQTEVVNLVWVLAILYQIKMLNKIPLYADEIGRTFDPVHRMQILQFLETLLNSGTIEQMFMVNHYASLTGGFKDCDLICLDDTNMIDIPSTVNENVEIIRY